MNKKLGRVLSILGCTTLAIATLAFGACGDGGSDNTEKKEDDKSGNTTYTVTFNYNYDGAPAAGTTNVSKDEVPTLESPTREGYIFDSWYTDANCTVPYTGTAVTGDLTLYAAWTETVSSSTSDVNLFRFEAEYVDLAKFKGAGYSGGATGIGAIVTDYTGSAQASNGYFVSYLYKSGDSTALNFTINSDTEVDDAMLVVRLSAEYTTHLQINSTDWQVIVNDVAIDYGEINIYCSSEAAAGTSYQAFLDKLITRNLHLNKGENTIQLRTNNSRNMGGTMYATAPMVDCLKIYTTAHLEWEPVTDNLTDLGKEPMDDRVF
jgi:uncharacterized repeat protein (TIGR02543 family)